MWRTPGRSAPSRRCHQGTTIHRRWNCHLERLCPVIECYSRDLLPSCSLAGWATRHSARVDFGRQIGAQTAFPPSLPLVLVSQAGRLDVMCAPTRHLKPSQAYHRYVTRMSHACHRHVTCMSHACHRGMPRARLLLLVLVDQVRIQSHTSGCNGPINGSQACHRACHGPGPHSPPLVLVGQMGVPVLPHPATQVESGGQVSNRPY